MKTGICFASALFVAAVVIGIVQLWFTPWRPDIFVKLELTVGAAFVVVVVICLVIREYTEDKANRGGDHLS